MRLKQNSEYVQTVSYKFILMLSYFTIKLIKHKCIITNEHPGIQGLIDDLEETLNSS